MLAGVKLIIEKNTSLELSKRRVPMHTTNLFLPIQSETKVLSTDNISNSVMIHNLETILNEIVAHFEHIHAYPESSPDNATHTIVDNCFASFLKYQS